MHPLCIALILSPNIILRIFLCIAYASLMHGFDFIPKYHLTHSLCISYASLTHSFDFIPTHNPRHPLIHSFHINYAQLPHLLCIALILYPNIILRIPYAYLIHPFCIALISYPNIILHIPLCIAYTSLMQSFDFIPKHHLTHSFTHSLCLPYA